MCASDGYRILRSTVCETVQVIFNAFLRTLGYKYVYVLYVLYICAYVTYICIYITQNTVWTVFVSFDTRVQAGRTSSGV